MPAPNVAMRRGCWPRASSRRPQSPTSRTRSLSTRLQHVPSPPSAKAEAFWQAAAAVLEESTPAERSSMARQVPRQVLEAAVDLGKEKHTGQASSATDQPHNPRRVDRASRPTGSQLNQVQQSARQRRLRPIGGCSAKTGESILKLSPSKKSTTRRQLRAAGTCTTSST